MAGPLPQKNKNTKRADDWRAQLERQNVEPVRSPWKTSKRRRPLRPANSWESWWAGEFRKLNEPVQQIFRPDAKLIPSQVDDQRAPVGLLGSIARWWTGQATLWEHIRYRLPRQEFPADTPLGRVQRQSRNYREPSEYDNLEPAPGPTPRPSQPAKIMNPGLLSKYRR